MARDLPQRDTRGRPPRQEWVRDYERARWTPTYVGVMAGMEAVARDYRALLAKIDGEARA